MRDFVIAPGHGILIIPKRYLQEIFSVGRVPYKVIDCGLYLQHGLPGLDFFLHPKIANLVVMVEINNEREGAVSGH